MLCKCCAAERSTVLQEASYLAMEGFRESPVQDETRNVIVCENFADFLWRFPLIPLLRDGRSDYATDISQKVIYVHFRGLGNC